MRSPLDVPAGSQKSDDRSSQGQCNAARNLLFFLVAGSRSSYPQALYEAVRDYVVLHSLFLVGAVGHSSHPRQDPF